MTPENKETLKAKTPQGKRFSGLFNVAAISANRHGIGCYSVLKLIDKLVMRYGLWAMGYWLLAKAPALEAEAGNNIVQASPADHDRL